MTAKDLLLFENESQTEEIIYPPKTLFQVAYNWSQTLLIRHLEGFPPVNLYARDLLAF